MGKVISTKFEVGGETVVDWNQPAANYLIEAYPVGADAFSSLENARKAVRLEQRLEFATQSKSVVLAITGEPTRSTAGNTRTGSGL